MEQGLNEYQIYDSLAVRFVSGPFLNYETFLYKAKTAGVR